MKYNESDIFENHAYLVVDELENLKSLFDLDINNIIVDLRGRTTINKKREIQSLLGSRIIEHSYILTDLKGEKLVNKNDIDTLITKFKSIGAENIYAVRLIVEWNNGEKERWDRHILYTIDPIRESKSTRLNALTLKVGKNKDVEQYKLKYGDFVKKTICEKQDQRQIIKKRVCKGIWL